MKILYVSTISNTVNTFLIPHIQMLIEDGHQVDVAFKIEQEVKKELVDMGCEVYNIPFQRFPLSVKNLQAYKEIKNIIEKGKYDLIHTHTPVASAITRLACKKNENIKIFYTAHGFHFYKGAPIINWLIYYPIEKHLAKYTDVLITINTEDYERAKRLLKAKRIEYIPGVGIDVEKFKNINIDKALKRKEIGISKDSFLMVSVGELNKNKNHAIVIKALAEMQNNKIDYAVCGTGPLKEKLLKLAKKSGLESQVHLLGHRNDIPEILAIADLFVFPSLREGLPVSLMEAIAAGVPVVASDIRGNRDLVVNGKNGYLVDCRNAKSFIDKIEITYKEKILLLRFLQHNIKSAQHYMYKNILKKIKEIYA